MKALSKCFGEPCQADYHGFLHMLWKVHPYPWG